MLDLNIITEKEFTTVSGRHYTTETKTGCAVLLFSKGEYAKALKLFKGFRINVDQEDRRIITIAYECLTGSSEFYKGLGIDPEQMIESAKEIIKRSYE